MTPQAAAALRCPVCGGALMPLGTSLRCPQGHSYDMAKEGYVNLLAIQKHHTMLIWLNLSRKIFFPIIFHKWLRPFIELFICDLCHPGIIIFQALQKALLVLFGVAFNFYFHILCHIFTY